jgi:hypothetical protein
MTVSTDERGAGVRAKSKTARYDPDEDEQVMVGRGPQVNRLDAC